MPALTRILPGLAALDSSLLQMAAITFHVARGEFTALPLNFVLLAIVAFVLCGGIPRAPDAPRR